MNRSYRGNVMKYILFVLVPIMLCGCSLKYTDSGAEARVGTDNLIYSSGTCIGLNVSMSTASAPLKAVIGYDNLVFISKPKNDKSTVDTGIEGEVGFTGKVVSGKQHINIGK